MFETIVTILIFVAVIAITAVLFGGWLVLTIVRALGRAILPPRREVDELPMLATTAATTARCPNERCRAENPPAASFCRRCGTAMRSVQQVPVRRVAMW
jgi:hypothetical protein